MLCPVCRHSKLRASRRDGISIWSCADCGGVWLESTLLEKLAEMGANRRDSSVKSEGVCCMERDPALALPKRAPIWQECRQH